MNAYQKWMRRLSTNPTDSSTVTIGRSEVISLRRIINDRNRPYEERRELLDRINEIVCNGMREARMLSPFLVDAEQTREGLEWCGSVLKRVKSKKKNRVFEDDRMQEILELVRSKMFREFRFGGFMLTSSSSVDRQFGLLKVIPIWQVWCGPSVRVRSYAYGSWQSGIGYIPDPGFEL